MHMDSARGDKSGLSVVDVAQASSRDLRELQNKLEDGGKDSVENLPRPGGGF